jgi:hypothetical protein
VILFQCGDEIRTNHKMFKFIDKYIVMRKNNSKEKKIEKQKSSHQSLENFYSQEQKQQEIEQKHRKTITDTEMEIFEHLKNHTKKVLKK